MRPTASLLLSLLVVMSAESRPLSKRPAQLHELKGRQLHVRAATKSLEMVAANTGQRARRSGGRKQVVGRVLQDLVRVQHPAPPALPGFLKELSISFAQCYHERDFAAVIDAIAHGEVAPQPMHTATVGFDELPEVFDSLRGASPHCKVLIDPSS